MSDVKREIIFSESMTIDKRNADFAYLRKNCFKSRTKGLYPAQDFYEERPDDLTVSEDIEDILGSEEDSFDIKVITTDGTNLNFNDLGSNSSSNSQLANTDYVCGVFGDDGVHIAADDGHIWKVQHANSNTSDLGAFPAGMPDPDIAGFDGLYYWWLSRNEICKQLGGDAATIAFNDTGFTPRFVDFFGDQMVIFGEEAGNIIIAFWDKSDTDLYDKRIIVKNARLIRGGVVNGRLMLIKSVGNSSNVKEQNGEIVVCAYDGEKFQRINSIKAGDDIVTYEATTASDVGSEVMVFGITGNISTHNGDLYKDFVFKVYDDGAIEVLFSPDTTTYGDVHVVRIFYNFIAIAQRGVGSTTPPIIWINEATNEAYGGYEDYTTTEYITNFLNEPYNDHKLDGFMVAFEKLFEQTDAGATPPTGEELDVYYRVSERDSWTLLMNVTVEKVKNYVNQFRDQSAEYTSDTTGLPEQRYAVSMMPDGETPLPEFNEIQFKFVSKRGFSIIGAWYRYSYVTRNSFE